MKKKLYVIPEMEINVPYVLTRCLCVSNPTTSHEINQDPPDDDDDDDNNDPLPGFGNVKQRGLW